MILYIKNRSFCFLEIIYTFNVDCFDSKRKLKTYKTVFIGFFLHAALSEIIIPNCNVARPKESIVLWGVKNRLNRNPGPVPVRTVKPCITLLSLDNLWDTLKFEQGLI